MLLNDLLLGTFYAAWLFVLWGIVANIITFRQRMNAIHRIFEHGACASIRLHLMRQVTDDVSYYAHYWRLLTFRNPITLYPWNIRWAFGDGEVSKLTKVEAE